MKTQAWGWLVAGVMALGLNGLYHDGGLGWAHQIADQVGSKAGYVLALATGRADEFLAQTQVFAARGESASSQIDNAVAVVQGRVARSQTSFSRLETMVARQQAACARLEAHQARMEAKRARMEALVAARVQTAALVTPMNMKIACPHVRVVVPRISTPMVHIAMPQVVTPELGPI